MKRFALLLLSGLIFSVFTSVVHADIPARDNLILELNTNGVLSDTSGNGRTIKQFGNVSVVAAASGSTWSHANFAGSGQISSTLSWAAGETSAFTLSFWVKTSSDDRNTLINNCLDYVGGYRYYLLNQGIVPYSAVPQYPMLGQYSKGTSATQITTPGCARFKGTDWNWNPATAPAKEYAFNQMVIEYTASGKTLHTELLNQQIFSFKKGSGSLATDLGIQLTPEYKCLLDSGGEFDCSKLKDNGWHNIVLKRNYYKTLEVFLDGEKANYWKDSKVTTSRYLYIGKNATSTSWDADLSQFKGNISAFRLFNADLTDGQVQELYSENSAAVSAISPDIPVISINQPSLTQASFKKITASTSTGTLSYAVTITETCNATLAFEDYSDMIFSNTSDNGTRICYQAVNGTIKVYKLSEQIKGITGTYSGLQIDNVFGDAEVYKSWPSSLRLKAGDYTRGILSTVQWTNFIDINGDGLVDILYNASSYLGIFVNTGDYNFKPVYKCKTVPPSGNVSVTTYYGDCADMNYKY